MKVTYIASIAILFLLLALPAPVNARQDRQDDKQDHPEQKRDKPEKDKREQPKPEQTRPEQTRPQHQAAQEQPKREDAKQQEHAQDQQRKDQAKQQDQARQQQQKDQNNQQQRAQQARNNQRPQRSPAQHRIQQSAWQQHRAHSWQSDHRSWQQRGGYNGYRIPDDRFRGYFGPQHYFRIEGLPFLVIGGDPRFQYQGYWITAVDPWPEYWADDWYDTDDVYVAYVDNGYYLYNRRYPDVGIAISISM
jgi:hypothetical protein